MSRTTTYLVSGATGHVGSALFERLHREGRRVRGGSRTPESAGLPPDSAVRFDLNAPETFSAALDGVDKVFLYAQAAHVDQFLEAACALGKPHVVFLSSLAVALPGAETDAVALRHLVQERSIIESGLAYTFLQPSDFALNAISPLDWAETIRSSSTVRAPYPDSGVSPIHELDIADVAFHVMASDDYLNDALVLTGPDIVAPRQQVESIGVALGKPVSFHEVTTQEWAIQIGPRLPEHVVHDYLSWWARCTDNPTSVTDSVERVTGRPARPHLQWASDHLRDFR